MSPGFCVLEGVIKGARPGNPSKLCPRIYRWELIDRRVSWQKSNTWIQATLLRTLNRPLWQRRPLLYSLSLEANFGWLWIICICLLYFLYCLDQEQNWVNGYCTSEPEAGGCMVSGRGLPGASGCGPLWLPGLYSCSSNLCSWTQEVKCWIHTKSVSPVKCAGLNANA